MFLVLLLCGGGGRDGRRKQIDEVPKHKHSNQIGTQFVLIDDLVRCKVVKLKNALKGQRYAVARLSNENTK